MVADKFGRWAPCRKCKDGMVRGSGMDKHQRRALRRSGGVTPTMHKCEVCGGRAYILLRIADAPTQGPAKDGFGW